jgi:tripartite-type tricarboxylate transporter receptor subunit TctC
VKDFAPVILVVKFPLIMAVNAELPAQTVNDVIALAKAKPGELTFSSSGSGGAPHLAGELFKSVTGTDLLHVPYRGSGPAVIDLIAGRITMMFDATPSLLPHIVAGKLRPLAAASQQRHRCCPMSLRSPNSAIPRWTSRFGMASRPRRHAGADRATAQRRAGENPGHA